MYRVAIVVNENETLHSVYADAERTIKCALKTVYGDKVDDLYSFEVFDKFNISSLFEPGANNILTFDSLFIATNACNNKEIDITLSNHLDELSLFIDDKKGCHHGIFVSNQQKLGGDVETAKMIGFLPPQFSYRLVKRDEKRSSDGKVTISCKTDLLVCFPNVIDNATIARSCSGLHNQFMPHKYRFILQPAYDSTYETLYCDDTYKIGNKPQKRPLLLKSRVGNERIVVTSMVLDWAEHLEQLANIVVFITEGVNHFAFVEKKGQKDPAFSRYIKRALDYNIALKRYDEVSAKRMLERFSAAENVKSILPHRIFVFSSCWSGSEVKELWNTYISSTNNDVSFYRLVTDTSGRKNVLCIDGSFSKSIRNSQMFLCADEWLAANFLYSKWRKSIWTYEYVLWLYSYMKCTRVSYVIPLLEEIKNHFKIQYTKTKKTSDVSFSDNLHPELFERKEFQTYDNVFNSTCACCNVLAKIYYMCKVNRINDITLNAATYNIDYINDLALQIGNWIMYRIDCKEYSKRISWQDYITAFVKIYESGYVSYVKANDPELYDLVVDYSKVAYNMTREKVFEVKHSQKSICDSISNPDLCKVLRFLYVYYILNGRNIEDDVHIIEKCLVSRQKYNGQWKNLSETSEIALSLLCREEYSLGISRSAEFDKMVNRAVNYIQQEYIDEKSCWLDDENTTAKSMNVILHYDDVYNFAYDDFIVDLVSNTNRYSQAVNVNNNIKALDHAQLLNNALQSQIEEKDKKLQVFCTDAKKKKKLIRRFGFIVAFLSSAFASALLLLICLLGILASKYYSILREIIAENVALIISTTIGIVITVILSGIAVHAKTKLIEGSTIEEE